LNIQMADATAAFFAKKKKGKKKPKSFNANKIDVSEVASNVHVDAPPIAGTANTQLNTPADTISKPGVEENVVTEDEEWASSIPTQAVKTVVVTQKKSSELLDMTALEERRRDQDDIQERMRIQGTKNALAKARQGMEREAVRLKEEGEMKQEKDRQKVTATVAATGGRWVPPHLRNARMKPVKLGNKPDTKDEDAFPDLAAANELIEKQKMEEIRQASMTKRKKKDPWGQAKNNTKAAPAASLSAKPKYKLGAGRLLTKSVSKNDGSKSAGTGTPPTSNCSPKVCNEDKPLPEAPPSSAGVEGKVIEASPLSVDKATDKSSSSSVQTPQNGVSSAPGIPVEKAPVEIASVEKASVEKVKKKKKKKKDLSSFKKA